MYYRGSECFTLAFLVAQQTAGMIRIQEPLSDDLFSRVLDGAEVSPYLRIDHKAILIEQGLIV